MIHFTCVYCGARVVAKEACASRVAKCPACGHKVRVPRSNGAQPASPGDVPKEPARQDNDCLAGMSNEQIAKTLLKKRPLPGRQERLTTRRELSPLMPHYDNLTLFALSVGFLFLGLTGSFSLEAPTPLTVDSSIADVFAALAGELLEKFTIFIPLAFLGMLLSLLGVFTRGEKAKPIKFVMLSFATLATSGTGVYAGIVILGQHLSWPMMIFPLWNIVHGIGLLSLFRMGLMDPDCIVNRRPSALQVIVTTVSVLLLLVVCRYALHLHWAIAYSICIGYTLSLNHTVQDVFGIGTKPPTDTEQIAVTSESSRK